MKPSRLLPILFAIIFVGCAHDDWRSTRWQWSDRTRYLAGESKGLCNDVRDHLTEHDRWPAQGRDGELWSTTLRIRDDADRLAREHDYYLHDESHYSTSLTRMRERLGYVRSMLGYEKVSREMGRRLVNMDALLWAMENDTDVADYREHYYREARTHPRTHALNYPQPFYRSYSRPLYARYEHSPTNPRDDYYRDEYRDRDDRRDYVRYSQPYTGAAWRERAVEPPRQNVGTHPGQGEYIRAHSAARGYVTRRHGLRNEDLQTAGVERRGDRFVVTLESPADRYTVTVDAASGDVLKESAKRR